MFAVNGIGVIGRKPMGRMQVQPVGVIPYLPMSPRPPGDNYSIPTPDVTVSTVADLATQVTSGTAKIIKVLNGSYSRTSELVAGAGHRIFCETASGVSFDFGFRFNYISGWEFHGGVFNITDVARAAVDGGFNGALLSWIGDNAGNNAIITDVTVDGGASFALKQGLQIGDPGGVQIERVKISRCTDEGIRASNNVPTASAVINRIWDCDIDRIYRSTRGASDGTAEAGIMVGHKVTYGVRRVRIRDTGWQGLAPNNKCLETTFSDLDIDTIYGTVPPGHTLNTGTGLYFERFCTDLVVERFRIGPDLFLPMNGEWNLGSGVGAMQRISIRDGTLRASRSATAVRGGVYMDEGSDANTIKRTHFLQGHDWACIGFYLNTNTPVTNFQGNNYSGRLSSSVRGTTVHFGDTPTEVL